jgi:hypothetical protein
VVYLFLKTVLFLSVVTVLYGIARLCFEPKQFIADIKRELDENKYRLMFLVGTFVVWILAMMWILDEL